jgi:hypothetical protein
LNATPFWLENQYEMLPYVSIHVTVTDNALARGENVYLGKKEEGKESNACDHLMITSPLERRSGAR